MNGTPDREVVVSKPPAAQRREAVVSWVLDALACAYCAWIALTLWGHTDRFAAMYQAMDAELPAATRIMVTNGHWIYPCVFGGLGVVIVVKEILIRDKRLSAIVTCLIALAAQFLGHWMGTVYLLPLFDLVKKLSG